MSDLVRTARAMIEAWNHGNVDRMTEYWTEDGDWRWEDDPTLAGAGTYTGREAVEAHLLEVTELLGEMQLEVADMRQVGDQVVFVASTRIHGAASGLEMDISWGHLVTFEDGRVRTYRVFAQPSEAFEAVGS